MSRWWKWALSVGALVVIASACTGRGAEDGGPGGAAGEPGGADSGNAGAKTSVLPTGGGEGGTGARGGQANEDEPLASCGHGPGGTGPGVDPPEPPGLDCNGDPLVLDAKLVEQCTLLTSCAPFGDASQCISDFDGMSFHFYEGELQLPWLYDGRIVSCAGELTSCDDVFACTGMRHATTECAQGQISRCDGDFAIDCNPHAPALIDCAKTTGKTGTCQVTGTGDDARAECVVVDECTPDNSSRARCAGDVSYRCDEPGPGYGIDCSQFGLTCIENWGTASCAAPLPTETCDSPGIGACDGSVIRYCGPGGVAFERDCSSRGDLTCVEGGGDSPEDQPWFDCAPPGCGERFEPYDRCDGDDVLLDLGMNGPPSARVHCPVYGFATCREGLCSNDPPEPNLPIGGAGGQGN